MKTDFTFHFQAGPNDLICQAHREADDIELDHIWLRDTAGTGYMDILPILEFEDNMFKSWLLEKIYEKGREVKSELHRESVMG
jgi:hypothetical protein